MPKVTWILHDDRAISSEVAAGHNLMEAAVANNVPDVIGECGGCLSCATCHVYVDATWSGKGGDLAGVFTIRTVADADARFKHLD